MEWTKLILAKFEGILSQAGIYGVVGVSQYPYHYCSNIWKTFLELWSPLTNTLHHGNGEMSISLWDLKMLGGLPISGILYGCNKMVHTLLRFLSFCTYIPNYASRVSRNLFVGESGLDIFIEGNCYTQVMEKTCSA